MRSVLGGLRTRSVLGGDDENMIWVVGRRDLGGGGSMIWDGRSLAEVSLEMGFGPCEECAWALSLQVWFPENVWR